MTTSATSPRVPHTRRRSSDPDGFPRRIDVSRFKEVGRINRPSQATSWEDYGARVAVLDELYDHGNLELLRAFRDGKVSMNALMRLKRQRRLDAGVGTLRLQQNLFEAFEQTLPRMGRKKKTRDGYNSLFVRMVRLSVPALTEHSRVLDLGRQDWRAVKARWANDGAKGQTWNNAVGMLSSFLSELLGRSSPERASILDQISRAPKSPGRVPDATPEQLASVIRRMPKRSGATALTLLVTGLRVEEWLGLDPEKELIHTLQAIRLSKESRREGDDPFTQDAKNEASWGLRFVAEGFWPIVMWAVKNRPSYSTLRRHWCQACAEVGLGILTRTKDDPGQRWPQTFRYKGMTLHDLRHSYAQIVSAAGLPLSQLRHALGHSDEASTARYAAQAAGRQAAQLAGAALGAALSLDSLWPTDASGTEAE